MDRRTDPDTVREYVLTDPTIRAPARVNAKGQCCGRKPIPYKRPPHLFCPRCNRAFDPTTGEQIANWAWRIVGDGFQSTSKRIASKPDPRDPDHSRTGIFVLHNCWKCRDGRDLSRCPTPDRPGNCGYPHARND